MQKLYKYIFNCLSFSVKPLYKVLSSSFYVVYIINWMVLVC